ncbi:MAG: putative RDD family membrane protein YckC [Marinoscillum sp.]
MTQKAGFWLRLMAYNIDLLVLLPCYYLLSLAFSTNQLLIVACLLVTILYDTGFCASKWQGTVGKHWVKIAVVNSQGQKMSFELSFLRTLLKLIFSFTLFIGYLVVAFHSENKAIHDMILGTRVTIST